MILDLDLQSVQEVRTSLQHAYTAQKTVEAMPQSEIDAIVAAMAQAASLEAGRLAALAVEETGFGNVADKTVKNLFAAEDVYQAIKAMKTVGIISRDERNQVWEVAQPVGIVAGIVPSTNPTSTAIFKSLIAVKSRNAIVFSPHPSAANCTLQTVDALQAAAERAGAPKGLLHCIAQPTLMATNELMKHKLTSVILATGGKEMVKAAYSSGKPAYGVGPGNVPVYVHSSADVEAAVKHIIRSKTFDYGTICASEQALIVDRDIKGEILGELQRQGAYVLNDAEKQKLAPAIMTGGVLNARIVGRSSQAIAGIVGISLPADTRMLVVEEHGVGKEFPLSVEKLSPILALYTVAGWQEAEALSRRLLELGGLGHTFGIHCRDHAVIERFGLSQLASRIVVNTGTTFGGIGATTGIQPSLTLGCGAFGNNITSDNIGPLHLMNVKRVAFGTREMPGGEVNADNRRQAQQPIPAEEQFRISKEEVIAIIKGVLSEMGNP